eukprot:SAG31_NODE_3130_length_4643_cov_264.060079_8_plen_67_part_00
MPPIRLCNRNYSTHVQAMSRDHVVLFNWAYSVDKVVAWVCHYGQPHCVGTVTETHLDVLQGILQQA